jgi:predicted NBD/HSP70 family sugar kinase
MISGSEIEVLRAIHLLETPTRAGIASFARFSTVSVTSVLTRLQDRGFVRSAGKAKSLAGRPSVIYKLASEVGYTIGIFIETTSCRLAAVDAAGSLLADRTLPLSLSAKPSEHVGEIVDRISREVRCLIGDPMLRNRRLLSIGVAPPGMVDTGRGLWLHGLRLSGIEHVDLGAVLERALCKTVLVEDPARCLAHLAVTRIGREQAGDLLLLYLGSGVGAGLVLGGELFRGHRGLAGELGHLVVEERGERCGCGNAGCLETVASVGAILRRFNRRLEEGVISSMQMYNGHGDESLSLEAIRDAAAGGDRLALVTLGEIGGSIGEACGKSIMLFNPRTLCIAGPVALLGEFMQDALWARVRQQVIPEMLADLRLQIMPGQPGDEALGAALLAARCFWDRLAQEAAEAAPVSAISAREVFQ